MRPPDPAGLPMADVSRGGQRDLLWQLELDFDRRALLPRLMVLIVLLVGALLDDDPIHGDSHWTVLAAYSTTTIVLAALSRLPGARRWLPWVGTVLDALVAVYAIGAHLPRNVHDAHRATDALSLLPALLFLLQTGLRLRPSLVVLFTGIVVVGWAASVAFMLGSSVESLLMSEGAALGTRLAQGFAAFLTASFIVLGAVSTMRRASAAAWRERENRLLVSRFLPEGVAGDVVRGGDAIEVNRRHACLLSIDIRGSSAMARDYSADRTVSWLLAFRRIVHDLVSSHRGIVDKYLGDGVIALFLEGAPQRQAADALAAARAAVLHLDAWNLERTRNGEPPLATIVALHGGNVLAGVFDDGRRAEFTVLGPAMNALPRIERRAKDAGVDVVASLPFLDLLPPSARDTLRLERLPPSEDADLPDLAVVSFGDEARRPAHEPADAQIGSRAGRA